MDEREQEMFFRTFMRNVSIVFFFSLAYLAGALVGKGLSIYHLLPATFWPPSGILLAALLLTQTRLWPFLILSTIITHAGFDWIVGHSIAGGLVFTLIHVSSLLLGTGFYRRWISPFPDLHSLKEVLGLIGITIAYAVLNAGMPFVFNLIGEIKSPWLFWKLSLTTEATGLFLYASLILTWSTWRPSQLHGISYGKICEGVFLFGLLTALFMGGIYFYPDLINRHKFLSLPLLIWGALRFGPRGASFLTFLLCHMVMWVLHDRKDLFETNTRSLTDFMVMLQGFMGTASAVALVPAATLAEGEKLVQRLNKINRLNTVIGQINQMVVKTQDAFTLLREACQIIVDFGHFRMAWVGNVDTDTGDIYPIVHAGHEEGYLSIHCWRTDESPWGLGLVGVAFRRGTWAVITDSASDPSVKPWREEALKRGYRSGSAFRITLNDQTDGVLVIYSEETGFFDEEVVSILHEVTSDITMALDGIRKTEKRTEAEEALRRSNEQLTGIIQASPVGIVVLDKEGVVLGWNPTAEQMFGYSESEVLGKPLPTVPGEKQEELHKNIATVLSGETISLLEAQRQHKDGHMVDVAINTAPLRNKAGTIFGLVALYSDLTERKKYDEALRLVNERLSTIINTSQAGIVVLDKDAKVLSWNPAAERLFGYTEEEVLGKQLPNAPEGREEELKRNVAAVLDGTNFSLIECQRKHKDGHLVDVNISPAPIRGKDGTIIGLVAVYMDISERKRFDEVLRQTNERLANIIKSSPAGIVVLDRDGIVHEWNSAAEKIFGFTEQEVLGHPLPIAPKGMEDQVRDNIAAVFEGRSTPIIEGKRRHKDGHLVDVTVSPAPLRDKNGKIVALLAMYLDITERKRADEALRQSEEQFRLLTHNVPVGISFMAPDHRMTFANPAFTEITGYTLEDMPTKEAYFELAYPDPEYRKQMLDKWAQDMPAKAPFGTISHRVFHIRCKNGTDKDCIVRTVILADGSHLYTYYDITEQRQAEIALEESERRLRELLETVELYAVLLDEQGCITFVNDYLLQQTNWSRSEVLGKDWFGLFYPASDIERSHREYLSSLITRILIAHCESSILTRDGGVRLVTWNNTFLKDPSGQVIGMACLGIDVTEHRHLEEQYRQSQKMEAIGQLAGGVAHDFNNLLQAIQGYTDLALADLPDEGEAHQNLSESQKAIDRAAGLVRQLLAFSRRQTLQFRVIDLDEVIANLTKMLRRVIGEHIELEISTGCMGQKVHADPGQMEQILLNLCLNARDAMPDGGKIYIETSGIFFDRGYVEVNSWAKEGNYIQLLVTDTGCGMPPEVLEKIFDPFFTTKKVGQGTGLGLATVYGIIRQHEGMIHVYSEVGHGTTFHIYLPVSTVETPQIIPDSQDQPRPRGGNETILVAEDEDLLRNLAQRILQNAGYTVLTASDGEEAMELYRTNRERIDLLLLDMVMPRASGIQVYEYVARENPKARFIFSTGYSFTTLDRGILPKEDIPFIQKPYSPMTLLKVVRDVLGE